MNCAGLVRSKGDPSVAGWGVAIFAGAFMTFIMAGIGRKRLSGNRPEQYLELWQKNAEKRSAGLLMRMGVIPSSSFAAASCLSATGARRIEPHTSVYLHGCDRRQGSLDRFAAFSYRIFCEDRFSDRR